LLQSGEKSCSDPIRQQLRRGVSDRQQHTIVGGKDPAASVGQEGGGNFFGIGHNPNQRMARREQHPVLQLIKNLPQLIPHGDEVHDILVFIQLSMHLARDAIVVPVQALADVPRERDEVRRAEDVVLFVETDVVGGGHSSGARY